MKDILIATCGTSILTNQREIKEKIIGDKRYSEISKEEVELLRMNILEFLKDKNADERRCGAELNSIYYLINDNKFSGQKIYLIVSDSIEGRLAGELIEKLLKEKLGINEIIIKIIEGLNIGVAHIFAKKGLKYLADDITKIIISENKDNILIAPVGGLKALIIIVALIGQNFYIPCYYLFEGTKDIIKVLPFPTNINKEELFEINIKK